MSEKRIFVLGAHPESRQRAIQAVKEAADGMVVRISPPTRSLQANAAMWAMLTDISNQVIWHGQKLDQESWKHVFSSSLKKQNVVPNLDGTGFVVMGISTIKMTKQEMSDMLELISAFGVQHDVKWSL